jgi:hypothetical protein
VLEAILDDLEEFGVHSESERKTFVQQMLDSGLWESAENVIIVHDYLDYNPSRQDVLRLRKIRTKAGRVGGQASAKQRAKERAKQKASNPAKQNPTPSPSPPPLKELRTLAHWKPVRVNGFDSFWASYPRKKSKGQAERAWAKLQPDEQLQGRILSALELAKTSADWTENPKKYIPYPATWLNAKGWEDEVQPATDPYADLPEGRACAACGGVHEWRDGRRLEPCLEEGA